MRYTEEEKREKATIIIDYIFDNHCSVLEAIKKTKACGRQMFYDVIKEYEDIRDNYTRAIKCREDHIFDEILKIADTHEVIDLVETIEYDNGTKIRYDKEGNEIGEERNITSSRKVTEKEAIEQRKLQIEARKWVLGRMNPKKYGNKVDVTSDGEKIQAPAILTNNPLAQNNDE